MEEKSFSFNFDDLVSDTLVLSVNVSDLYGRCRKDLVAKWKEIFTMATVSHDDFNDWGQVRALFWSKIQQQVLADDSFRMAIDSILVELYGQKEGMRGSKVIFTPPFRYK